ncbi:MAG: hypothetical protein GY847_19505 [Proteobacteria bacterium]|nr:hypothetical protein [Pseudomonadota bacterium]
MSTNLDVRILTYLLKPPHITRAFLLAFFCNIAHVTADIPDGAVLIDGLAVLAGGIAADESDSIAVYLSDVEFEAALLRIRRFGPAGVDGKLDKKTRLEARRSAILIRMLARQAKQFQEVVDPGDSVALRDELIARAGGLEAMERLFARFGMNRNDLKNWTETALLATTQIRYVEDQVDIPSDREIINRIEDENPYETAARKREVYEAYRNSILKARTDQMVRSWLQGILTEGRVRIMQ